MEKMGRKITRMIVLLYVFIEYKAEGKIFKNDSLVDFDLKQFKGVKRQTTNSSMKFKEH